MVKKQQLIELGFSDKEAVVYLALLELGPAKTTEIARKAKINRTTAYDVLENLASEGLVNLIGEAKVQKYVAENPEKVIRYLEKKAQESKERINQAKNLLPQLLSVYNVKEKPRVRFYEGAEGMKEAFEDTLSATEGISAYAVGEDMFQALGREYFQNYFQQRVKNGISVRVIAPDTLASRTVIRNDKKEMRTTILVPRDKFNFSVETNIYNNKILIVSWQEKFAVIIESKEIAEAQKKTFELAWLGAKSLQEK